MPYIGRAATNAGSVNYLDDISSGFDGSDTTFTCAISSTTITPGQENVYLYLDGVFQHPTDAYTISGSTITFTEAPASGVAFTGYVAGEGAYLDDGTVSTAKLDDDAVTASKLDDDGTGFQVGDLGVGGSLTSGDKLTVTGRLRASGGIIGDLTGDVTGNVTGNASGTAATVTGAAQSAITSVGTSLGIGTSSLSSYDSYYNNLVVYEDGHAGIAIIGNTSSETSLGFGDGTSAATYRGAVAYVHTSGSHQDKMFFKTAASNRMVIDSSGNLGVGTTSPTTKLHLSDGASTAVIAKFTNDTTGNTINDGSSIGIDGDGDLLIYNVENKEIKFYTNDTQRAVIDNSGRVGIGLTSPAYTLDLSSSDSIVSQFTGSSGETILSLDNTSTNGDKWYLISGGSGGSFAGGKFGIYNADTTTAVATFENDGTVVIPGAIQSTGNVSITSTAKYFQVMSHVDTNKVTKHAYDGLYTSGSQNMFIQSGQDIKFYPGGTHKVTFLDDGGITFNGDTATANALDDYEEGTYTITITGSNGGSWTMRSGYTKGSYTKIGRLVTVTARYETSSKSGESGELRFNLPFTCADLTDQAGGSVGSITLNRSAYTITDQISPVTFDNVAYFSVQRHENGQSETYMQASDIDGTFEGHFTLTYVAA